jgi:acyl-coenzyme A synthetase/AMP-(fatty) acid ligase
LILDVVSNLASTPIALIGTYQPAATIAYHHGQPVSQHAFLQQVMALAQQLPGDGLVINLCRNRYRFMLGFGAALVARSASLLPPNRQPGTLDDIAEAYPRSVCLHDEPGDASFAGLALPRIRVDGQQGLAIALSEAPLIAPGQLAAIATTSGSTGKPAAHNKYWFTLCGTARLLARRLVKVGEHPITVATVPSQHMYGLEMTVMMALQGGCVIDDGHPFYPPEIVDSLQRLPRPRTLVTTPIHLRHLLDSPLQMPPVDQLVSATAPLDQALATAAETRFGGRLDEIFGFTEAGSIATRRSSVEQAWVLLDGMRVSCTNGRTSIRGWQLPAPERLQDLIESIDEQHFRYLGRAADMINVGGKRASLAELTQKLLQIDGVIDGVVFLPDSESSQRPAALVVSELEERQIVASLARSIDPVLLPRPIKKVGTIPRNATGKVTRDLLHRALRNCSE